ncbi:PREDICTED: uncharacterized protein LOC100634888 [Amphimedon queenslandica]|uniref:Endosome-associated-trafficking regulator 1 n=1 Tax=Amphimedon queenslandica TaxID=400682 RepID=A0A1X7VG06_AMPQE|nr:PREDICTED: uncharacterized protein LOC100634888 [Amphimedon queenslandica]|eukprot:XP_019849344.1 PREDICTED: uncharacterized protein LOC100634888 [Amphimedon queenslandica]
MASKENDKDNPFSFKSFVTKRQGGGSEPQKKESSKRKKKTGEAATSAPPTVVDSLPPPGSVASDVNPFSFKNFVKKAKDSGDDDSLFSSEDENPLSEPTKLGLPLLAPNPVPVAVGIKTKAASSSRLKTEPVKDLFSSSSEDEIELLGSSTLPPLPLSDPLGGSEREEEEEEGGILDINPFPEVAMLAPDETQHQLVNELNKVKAENEVLKKQVTELEKNYKKEKGRSQSLKDEVKLLKEKEAKDTKALDDMIQKVEENLKIATQRSITADETIKKLKGQIASLQTQLGQANPQAIHKSYEDLIIGVREKANNASQQLKAASYKADLQIKELCHGIEVLKLVSDTLENIDSIFEVKK